jgi:hypothetical protein
MTLQDHDAESWEYLRDREVQSDKCFVTGKPTSAKRGYPLHGQYSNGTEADVSLQRKRTQDGLIRSRVKDDKVSDLDTF